MDVFFYSCPGILFVLLNCINIVQEIVITKSIYLSSLSSTNYCIAGEIGRKKLSGMSVTEENISRLDVSTLSWSYSLYGHWGQHSDGMITISALEHPASEGHDSMLQVVVPFRQTHSVQGSNRCDCLCRRKLPRKEHGFLSDISTATIKVYP